MKLRETELVRDKFFHRVLLSLLESTLIELYRFVFYALLKDEVCTSINAHGEQVMITTMKVMTSKAKLLLGIFDAVIDHLD